MKDHAIFLKFRKIVSFHTESHSTLLLAFNTVTGLISQTFMHLIGQYNSKNKINETLAWWRKFCQTKLCPTNFCLIRMSYIVVLTSPHQMALDWSKISLCIVCMRMDHKHSTSPTASIPHRVCKIMSWLDTLPSLLRFQGKRWECWWLRCIRSYKIFDETVCLKC